MWINYNHLNWNRKLVCFHLVGIVFSFFFFVIPYLPQRNECLQSACQLFNVYRKYIWVINIMVTYSSYICVSIVVYPRFTGNAIPFVTWNSKAWVNVRDEWVKATTSRLGTWKPGATHKSHEQQFDTASSATSRSRTFCLHIRYFVEFDTVTW